MTAWQRTNILEREEKGLGPISFKRLLISGGAGLLITMLAGRIVGFTIGCAAGSVIISLILILTHPKDGFALYSYFIRTLRGLAILAAVDQAAGPLWLIGQALQVRPTDGIVLAAEVYHIHEEGAEPALPSGEWAFLGTFADADDEGLAPVTHPFAIERTMPW